MKLLTALACLLAVAAADDYVSLVQCYSGYLTVTLNDESSLANDTYMKQPLGSAIGITFDDESSPVTNCSAVIAPPTTGQHSPSFNLYYDACNVTIMQPEGGDAIVNIPLKATPILAGPYPPIYTFEVSCEYTSEVTQDGGITVTVPSGGGSGGDHGGSSGSNVKGLTAAWYDTAGNAIGSKDVDIRSTTRVIFRVDYAGVVYGAFLPLTCYFSGEKYTSGTPPSQKIPFVYGACPASYQNFYTHNLTHTRFDQLIKPFRFPGYDLLWGHCLLDLCVKADNPTCDIDSCWHNNVESFMALPAADNRLAANSGQHYAYASLGMGDGGGSESNDGGSKNATIVGATLGTILGLLVICGIILGAFFMGRRKRVEPEPTAPAPGPDPVWANNWLQFYKIPRAKNPETSAATTMY